VLLKRLINAALLASNVVQSGIIEPIESVPATGKISVRLRPEDLSMLRERATARSVPTGNYVSFLIRSHLRLFFRAASSWANSGASERQFGNQGQGGGCIDNCVRATLWQLLP